MARTANSVIAFEESQVGNDGSIYNSWFWLDDNGWAWCDTFQQYGFAYCGAQDLLCTVSAYCPTQMNAMRAAGLEIGGPQRGAIVFFDYNNDGEVDHIGLVRGSDGSEFYVVNGNAGEPGEVRLTTYNTDAGYGCYFFMPRYDGVEDALDLWYQVHTIGHGWCEKVHKLEDYAGILNDPIDAVAIYANDGHHIDYQVTHADDGSDGAMVSSDNVDINNADTGYAGTFGRPIATFRGYAHNDNQSGERLQYRVAPLNADYYDWQFDYETVNGQDGFAGLPGQQVDRLQMC